MSDWADELTDAELSELIDALLAEPDDIGLSNIYGGSGRVRLDQDALPAARRSEDRLQDALSRVAAGTYTYSSPAVYGFASPAQGAVTGTATCGPATPEGYCMNMFHEGGCGSAATPDIIEGLRADGVFERKAMSPVTDSRGLEWRDAQYGSPMTMTDHIEALTGQRLGDADPYSVRPRRELVSPARPAVYGDPDDPHAAPGGIPGSTAATAAALARQIGVRTAADTRADREAAVRQHDRWLSKMGPPRHADYREFSNPVHKERELVQVNDPWNGSLPAYTLAD